MEPLPPWNEVPYVAPQGQEAGFTMAVTAIPKTHVGWDVVYGHESHFMIFHGNHLNIRV